MADDRPGRLTDLARRAGDCRACSLREGCRGVVFGEGDPSARLVLVGEGPGRLEDEEGRPFVGPAGQLLDRILAAAGFLRREVYITNVVMCRPPANRVPQPDEVAACLPWLRDKLAVIRPRIVLCLGALAAQTLLEPGLSITRARGRWHEREGVLFMATFHPAAVLRDPGKKRPVWEDFSQIRSRYLAVAGD
ncbi:MAG: uracil-DNA glycosylase [bacterium]|nr:uracil-DNA glycosylase [bacterium]